MATLSHLELQNIVVRNMAMNQQAGTLANLLMGTPSLINGSHFGQLKYFRKKFKEYSSEEFRKMSNEPLVKEILAGMAKIPKEDIADRIKLHLED